MIAKLFKDLVRAEPSPHGGSGEVRIFRAFERRRDSSTAEFIHFVVVPPGSAIGSHRHGDDSEWYVILEGNGTMTIDGREIPVTDGDIVVNPPFGEHELVNDSLADLRLVVFKLSMASRTGDDDSPATS